MVANVAPNVIVNRFVDDNDVDADAKDLEDKSCCG
jgi:hypothetical protein